MTHGTIASLLLTDLIQERKNRWEDLYSPSRVTLKAREDYAGENVNVAGQFAGLHTAGDIGSPSIATTPVRFTDVEPPARTLAVLFLETRAKGRGIVLVTVRNILRMAGFITARPTQIFLI